MFCDALASFLSVTTRGVKLKISEVRISGKLLWDIIIIGFPILSLKILCILKPAVFTNELGKRKARNSLLLFHKVFKISVPSPNSLTNNSSFICHMYIKQLHCSPVEADLLN